MWVLNQTAVQGRGHYASETPCQDKVYSKEENGVVVSVLADGAGSAKYSHYGAETVTRQVAEYLCGNFDDIYKETDVLKVKSEILEMITSKLKEQALELQCEIKDLASTLLAVAIKEDKVLIAHLGDGIIGYRKKGEVKVLSHPENFEFSNVTVFTTSSDAYEHLRLFKDEITDVDGFILMSDGAGNSLYSNTDKKLAGAVNKIFNDPEGDLTVLVNNHILKRTTDDCSICTLTYIEQSEQPTPNDGPADDAPIETNPLPFSSQTSRKLNAVIIAVVVLILIILVFFILKNK